MFYATVCIRDHLESIPLPKRGGVSKKSKFKLRIESSGSVRVNSFIHYKKELVMCRFSPYFNL